MKTIVILLQIMGAATLIPWLFALMMSPMAFDSPDSTTKMFPYLLIGGLLLYPLLMGAGFWYAWRTEDIRLAVAISAVPVVFASVLFMVIMIS